MISPRVAARAEVIRCVRAAIDPALPLDELAGKFDALELAALRLVNVICELPARERPEGWEPDPGAVTA